jgi:hypothetical protein
MGLIKFNDSSCRPAVNLELTEAKEEELDILPSPEGGVIVLASKKGSAFHPLATCCQRCRKIGLLLGSRQTGKLVG